VFAVVSAVALAALVLGPIRAQRDPDMDVCWVRHFPDWSQPVRAAGWSVFATLDVCRYGSAPYGQVLGPLALVGAAALWRAGRRELIVLLAGPAGAAFLAACLHKYPFGGARVMAFALPGLVVLAAAGLAALAPVLRRRVGDWAVSGLLAAVVVPPAALAGYRVAVPWPRPDSRATAAYVLEHVCPGELVAAGSWELEYYLRGRELLTLPEVLALPPGTRVWVTLTGMDRKDRDPVFATYNADFRWLDYTEFRGASVGLLERPAPVRDTNRGG
jgi:hypothetical protein